MVNDEDIHTVRALNGRILATLSDGELALLHHYYERGRKHGVNVAISYPGFDSGDLPVQFRALLSGDRNVPIFRNNSVVAVNSESN